MEQFSRTIKIGQMLLQKRANERMMKGSSEQIGKIPAAKTPYSRLQTGGYRVSRRLSISYQTASSGCTHCSPPQWYPYSRSRNPSGSHDAYENGLHANIFRVRLHVHHPLVALFGQQVVCPEATAPREERL